MAIMKTNDPAEGMAAIGTRAKDVVAQVVPLGKQAGTTAVQGVANAKEWAAPRAADAVRGAREWAAPRLEDAADAVTTSVAPAVSSALRSTARQVKPNERARPKTGIRVLLDWRLLVGIGAAAAAAGAAAAVAMRRRYASATAAAENDTTVDAPDSEQADGSAAHSEVNGRVATPGT